MTISDNTLPAADAQPEFRVVKIYADGLRCLKAVDVAIDENSKIVELSGDNGGGKSSVLDALLIALLGVKAVTRGRGYPRGEIISRDAEAARVRVVLRSGERVIDISRTLTKAAGGDLKAAVKIADTAGRKIDQAFFNELINAIAIEPLALANMAPAEQQEVIKEVTGFDPKAFNDRRGEIRAARKPHDDGKMHKQNALIDLRKDVERLSQQGTQVVDYDTEIANATTRAKELQDKYQVDFERYHAARTARGVYDEYAEEQRRDTKQIAVLQTQIAELQEQVIVLQANCDERAGVITQYADDYQKTYGGDVANPAPAAPTNTDAQAATQEVNRLQAARQGADKVVALVDRIKTTEEELAVHKEKLREFAGMVEQINAEEVAAMQAMPLPNMGFDPDAGITLGGVPLAEHSTAEKIGAGLAMAGVYNPALKAVIIRDGSLLDDAALERVRQYASDNNLLVLLETVRPIQANEDVSTFYIKDGTATSAGVVQ